MVKWINKKRNTKGFTLIELIVVIAILGILVAIAVPRLAGSRDRAYISAHNANVRTLEGAANIAVTEGVKGEIWDGTKIERGLEYVQTWPKVPKGLVDRTIVTITKDEDGKEVENPTGEKFTATYEVIITDTGFVTVNPGSIPDGTILSKIK